MGSGRVPRQQRRASEGGAPCPQSWSRASDCSLVGTVHLLCSALPARLHPSRCFHAPLRLPHAAPLPRPRARTTEPRIRLRLAPAHRSERFLPSRAPASPARAMSALSSMPPSRRGSFVGTPLSQPPSNAPSAAPSRRGSFALSTTDETPEHSRPQSLAQSRRDSFAASPLFRRSSTAGQIPPEGLRRRLEGLSKVPPHLGDIGPRPSSHPDREAVQQRETEFVGCAPRPRSAYYARLHRETHSLSMSTQRHRLRDDLVPVLHLRPVGRHHRQLPD